MEVEEAKTKNKTSSSDRYISLGLYWGLWGICDKCQNLVCKSNYVFPNAHLSRLQTAPEKANCST